MKLIQYYKLIILVLLSCLFTETLKPSNSRKLEKVKISTKDDTRTYYHLNRRGVIEFKNLNKILDQDKNYNLKIIARTKVAKNSNSNKSFGFKLNIDKDGKSISKELKYKKKASLSKLPDKKGFTYTNAGFWVEEIRNPRGTNFSIESLKGSPEIEVRVVYNEIKPLKIKEIIYPVNIESPITVEYQRDDTYVKSKHWFNLDDNKQIQFKVKGPAVIKVRSRAILNNNTVSQYSFDLKENGKRMGIHKYNINPSDKDAHYFVDNERNNLTKFNSFLFNVPSGMNYYTLKNSKSFDSSMLIKVELLLDEK